MNIITLTHYKATAAKIKELEKELDALKSEIISEMNINTEIRVGQYSVSYKEIARTDIDKASLKNDLPDVFEKYEKTTTYNKLLIK